MPLRPSSRPKSRSSAGARGRRTQQRAQQTRERIQRAALAAFAEAGFDGASTREIAARAGVKQQLITYHFKTKLELWKAAADRIFAELDERFRARMRGLDGVDDATVTRLLARELVRFGAEHPELGRFMMHEGGRPGPRLAWLVKRHVKPLFDGIRERLTVAQAHGLAPPGDPMQLAYILLGASVMFAQAAEFKLLTGRDPRSPEIVEAHADLVVRLLLPGA